MISNITYPQAEALVDQIEAIKGVDQVEFDDSEDHFKGTSALYSITYTDEAESDVSVREWIRKRLRCELQRAYLRLSRNLCDANSELIMTGTELAKKIQKGIEEGIITTYKTLEEDHKISRSTINAWVNDGKYAKIKLKNQWILVKISE